MTILSNTDEIDTSLPLVIYGRGSPEELLTHYDFLKEIFPDSDVFIWGEAGQRKKLKVTDVALVPSARQPDGVLPYQWLHIDALLEPKPHIHTDGLPLEPWIPMTDPVDKKVVGKTMEELFEFIAATARLGQAVSRCFIQGVDEREPTTGKSNRDWLSDEIADVEANLRLMKERFALDTEAIEVRASMKWSRQRVWHKMPGSEERRAESLSDFLYNPDRGGKRDSNVTPFKAPPPVDSLIFSWGSKGDPNHRQTFTIPQMLRTLTDAEVYEIAEHKNSFFTASNGWTWNTGALRNALIDNGQMPERYRVIDTARK